MDKITKNPDSAKFTESPRTSNANSQIERYRLEISKKSESDFINTRKLTIQSTVKHEAPESNEIDKQISDLENLIKRLQDEIVEMSNNAEKPYQSSEDDPVKILEEDQQVDTKESQKSKITDDDNDTTETNSHVYPVIVKDVGFGLTDQSKKFADQVSDLVNYSGSSEVSNIMPKTFSSIRNDIDVLWREENLNNDKAGESKALQEDYHLQKLIGELKTEISEKLESLRDVTDGEPLNNSTENINP